MAEPRTTPVVDLSGVAKSFSEAGRERSVLHAVDLRLEPGELAVLLGRSGSGKSTLLNLVSGIDQPSAGRVLVAGRDLGRMSEHERTLFRRHHIGFVFQFFNLIPTLTVEENLLLPLELAGKRSTKSGGSRERAQSLLSEVGLADRRTSYPDRLSGGEQQRIAVARALIHDPDLVLADEPTGNLDLETGREVIELLDRLTRRAGKTLLMVSHDQALAEIADRVLHMADGRLSETRQSPQDRQTRRDRR